MCSFFQSTFHYELECISKKSVNFISVGSGRPNLALLFLMCYKKLEVLPSDNQRRALAWICKRLTADVAESLCCVGARVLLQKNLIFFFICVF